MLKSYQNKSYQNEVNTFYKNALLGKKNKTDCQKSIIAIVILL